MSDKSRKSKLPAWYRKYQAGTNPDMCGSGNKTGYRCVKVRKSKCKNCSRPVTCGKWVKASRKCGKKKSSPRKPSPSRASRRKSAKKSRRRKACKSNQVRNKSTGRCRKRKSAKKSRRRKACKSNQVRNKSTGRCRKRKSAKKSRRRKACKSNQVRNKSTGRCRKRKSAKKSRRRKSSKRRQSSKPKCVDLGRNGKTPSIRKKYSDRPSPPYPAVGCRGKIKIGNDGREWKSVRSGKSYRWRRKSIRRS